MLKKGITRKGHNGAQCSSIFWDRLGHHASCVKSWPRPRERFGSLSVLPGFLGIAIVGVRPSVSSDSSVPLLPVSASWKRRCNTLDTGRKTCFSQVVLTKIMTSPERTNAFAVIQGILSESGPAGFYTGIQVRAGWPMQGGLLFLRSLVGGPSTPARTPHEARAQHRHQQDGVGSRIISSAV